MRLPELATRHGLLTMVLACLTAGLVLGWFATPLPEPGAARSYASSWAVPPASQVKRFDDRSFGPLLRSPMWGSIGARGNASSSGRKGAGPAWSLVGIVTSPAPVALVLDRSTGKVDRFEAGAALPGGAQLTTIERSAITVDMGGCVNRVGLFDTKKSAGIEECATPAEAGSAPSRRPE